MKKKVIHHSLKRSRKYLENKPQRQRLDNERSTDYMRKIRLYCENGKFNQKKLIVQITARCNWFLCVPITCHFLWLVVCFILFLFLAG